MYWAYKIISSKKEATRGLNEFSIRCLRVAQQRATFKNNQVTTMRPSTSLRHQGAHYCWVQYHRLPTSTYYASMIEVTGGREKKEMHGQARGVFIFISFDTTTFGVRNVRKEMYKQASNANIANATTWFVNSGNNFLPYGLISTQQCRCFWDELNWMWKSTTNKP